MGITRSFDTTRVRKDQPGWMRMVGDRHREIRGVLIALHSVVEQPGGNNTHQEGENCRAAKSEFH